jgi:hypothetical protein
LGKTRRPVSALSVKVVPRASRPQPIGASGGSSRGNAGYQPRGTYGEPDQVGRDRLPAHRRKLEVAIGRLVAGTVTPPDGKLTGKNIAAGAGVSKATADQAVDLREEFRRQLAERVPAPTAGPRTGPLSRSDVDAAVASLHQENAELKESTKLLHSAILALVQENQRLARRRPSTGAEVVAPASDSTDEGNH